MPKYIQMGTGKLTASPSNTSYLATPDILTEISNFQLTPDSSCISMETISTPAYSEHTDVSIIMQDYGNIDKGNPIIGMQGSIGKKHIKKLKNEKFLDNSFQDRVIFKFDFTESTDFQYLNILNVGWLIANYWPV